MRRGWFALSDLGFALEEELPTKGHQLSEKLFASMTCTNKSLVHTYRSVGRGWLPFRCIKHKDIVKVIVVEHVNNRKSGAS